MQYKLTNATDAKIEWVSLVVPAQDEGVLVYSGSVVDSAGVVMCVGAACDNSTDIACIKLTPTLGPNSGLVFP